jgi:hypothetical protein
MAIAQPRYWTFGDGPLANRRIRLLTPQELAAQKPGTVVYSIWGQRFVVGQDKALEGPQDVRDGYLSVGLLE